MADLKLPPGSLSKLGNTWSGGSWEKVIATSREIADAYNHLPDKPRLAIDDRLRNRNTRSVEDVPRIMEMNMAATVSLLQGDAQTFLKAIGRYAGQVYQASLDTFFDHRNMHVRIAAKAVLEAGLEAVNTWLKELDRLEVCIKHLVKSVHLPEGVRPPGDAVDTIGDYVSVVNAFNKVTEAMEALAEAAGLESSPSQS